MSEKNLTDECFYAKQQRWGTWNSYDKDDKLLVTSLTEEQCISATRFHLKGLQEGFPESQSYDIEIRGKL